MEKVSNIAFVSFLARCADNKYGYIFGATGQNPRLWSTDSHWFTQYRGEQRTKALYWREHAARVFDCNGLAEAFYKDHTGIDINVRARDNYSNWCGVKGIGKIPDQHKVPGAALFIHSPSSGYITHVGYLEKPVDAAKPSGDWYVIEARGVMYGVVRTRLTTRSWNKWGLMTKYFDYGDTALPIRCDDEELGQRDLYEGCMGMDVKGLQEALVALEFSCGKWGADGEFGDATRNAVTAFQVKHGLSPDGIAGKVTLAMIDSLLPDDGDPAVESGPDTAKKVIVSGESVYVRIEPNPSAPILGVVFKGDALPFREIISQDGWYAVKIAGECGWISGKYSSLA